MDDILGSLPVNVSTYGGEIDDLYRIILYITVGTFFIVQLLLLFFMFKYRASASTKAIYTHGNSRLEVAWTLVPTVIVIMLGFMSKNLWARIKINMPPADVTVRVTGKQFNWEILYPGPDGKFQTADDYQVDNDLRVPVNKNVHVILASHDVIHSFFIPQARIKQDSLPGREIPAWFNITQPGVYEIPCAELCGFGHSGMKGQLTVYSEADYEKWLKEQWPPAGEAPQDGGAAPAGQEGEAAPPAEGEAAPPASGEAAPAPSGDGSGGTASRGGDRAPWGRTALAARGRATISTSPSTSTSTSKKRAMRSPSAADHRGA